MGPSHQNVQHLIKQATRILQDSQLAVALTGAGISTPSGIPDYRSPKSGLWNDIDMLDVASIGAFRERPQDFYAWIKPLAQLILQAKPNAAHLALADLETKGPLAAVITQNIDLLHEKAGSRTVLEVHGNLREVVCLACHHIEGAAPRLEAFIQGGDLPVCHRCHHIMKPNVVLFGEILPPKQIKTAERLAGQCDVMIVAGTSLEVAPACDLPARAKHRGAKIIIINQTATRQDHLADVIIREDVAVVLPQLATPFVSVDAGSAPFADPFLSG